MSKTEQFSSRWGLILASLGMAIGAGNLWRFPRLAGQYGGSFILLWIFFLLLWSIPLLLAEFSIGKKFKKGVIGAYGKLAGPKMAWGGFFITICTMGIAFYYAVVVAWSVRYLGFSIGELFDQLSGGQSLSAKLVESPDYLQQYWLGVSNASVSTLVLYVVAILLGTWLMIKGIKKGWELANKILIPLLFGLLILIAAVSLNMANGVLGLEYMFSINWNHFSDPTIWIEALSQSAWSTGAGWGLMITIASYSRDKEDVTLNTFIGAFGNNSASLLAGMAILPAVFALSASEVEAVSFLQAGNQALLFTIVPELFTTIPGGAYLSIFFFLAFFLAAFSSLLPMLQLTIRNLVDWGLNAKKAAVITALLGMVFGFPSAYSLDFFTNQDWVWGVGLIVSGFLIIIAVLKYKVGRFKTDFIDSDSDFIVSRTAFSWSMFLNFGLAIVLVYWWMTQDYSANPWFDTGGNWNVFDVYSNASIVTQWGTAILLGIILNKWLNKTFVQS